MLAQDSTTLGGRRCSEILASNIVALMASEARCTLRLGWRAIYPVCTLPNSRVDSGIVAAGTSTSGRHATHACKIRHIANHAPRPDRRCEPVADPDVRNDDGTAFLGRAFADSYESGQLHASGNLHEFTDEAVVGHRGL